MSSIPESAFVILVLLSFVAPCAPKPARYAFITICFLLCFLTAAPLAAAQLFAMLMAMYLWASLWIFVANKQSKPKPQQSNTNNTANTQLYSYYATPAGPGFIKIHQCLNGRVVASRIVPCTTSN